MAHRRDPRSLLRKDLGEEIISLGPGRTEQVLVRSSVGRKQVEWAWCPPRGREKQGGEFWLVMRRSEWRGKCAYRRWRSPEGGIDGT